LKITKIVIENFEVHKYLELDLDLHVTVLVGDTNVGKSAVKRAIEWVVFNRPAGDDYRNWDNPDFTRVTLHTSEGFQIERHRSDKDNSYIISKAGMEPIELTGFGQTVPEEVSKVLNLKSINFQGQEDPTFLINDTSGEAARKLNEVANLELIDESLKRINDLYRKHNTEFKRQKEELKFLREEIKQFDWIEGCESILNEILTLTDVEKILDNDIQTVSDALDELDRLESEEAELSKDLEAKKEVVKELELLVDQANELSRIEKDIDDLEDILANIDRLESDEKRLKDLIESNKIKYNELMPDVCPFYEQACPLHKQKIE
jgi:exonuclease SbcC